MNWRGPFILALTLFVLGSFAYWMEYQQKPKREEQEEQAKKLFAIKEKQIKEIEIFTGKKIFAMKCLELDNNRCKPGDNSKWELFEPMKVRADDSNVNSLVSTLNNIATTETISLKDETPEKRAALLKEYGLDPASLNLGRKISVSSSIGKFILHLGQTHPIGESIFALKSDDEERVYLVPNYFKTNFEKELTHWRDKKLVSQAPQEVSSFVLETEKSKIEGSKQDGQWVLSQKGEQFTGDVENVEGFLSAVHYLTAKDFVAESKADKAGLALLKGAKPVLTLKLDKTVLALLRKGKSERLLATVSTLDPVFELEAGAKDRLTKELKDLRMVKFMTSMERFTAKRLEFSGSPIGAKSVVLNHAGDKWLDDAKQEVEAEKVQKILDKLSGNRIKEFLVGKQIPHGENSGVKVTLSDEKTPVKRQIVFWKNSNKLYARDLLSKRAEAFLVDTAVQEDLPWDAHFFKKIDPKAAKKPVQP